MAADLWKLGDLMMTAQVRGLEMGTMVRREVLCLSSCVS